MNRVKGFLASALLLCCGMPAHGAGVFRVDLRSTAPTPDGQSWATAYRTLQSAVNAAGAAGAGEVWVAMGVYTATTDPVVQMKTNVSLLGGFAGSETAREQRDWVANTCIIDGQDLQRCVKGQTGCVLDGFTVMRGNANEGGGFWTQSGGMTVAHCVFMDNTARTGSGGGMSISFTSASVVDCAFLRNTAENGSAGALRFYGSASDQILTATNCLFSGNSAGNGVGGGISAELNNNSKLVLTNCVFGENAASNSGGGVYLVGAQGKMTNCTFTQNSAAWGGAVYSTHALTLTNCVLWGNSAGNGPELHAASGTPQVTYCCVRGGFSGTGNIDADPLFAGASPQVQLQPGSPCIDTGTATGAPGTDILGRTRPAGAGVDMGAYEHGLPYPPAVASASVLTTDTTPTWSWITGGGLGTGYYRCGFTDGVWDAVSGAPVTSFTPASPLGDGPHTLYVQERDTGGNWSASGWHTVTIDANGPTGTVIINGGAETVGIETVTLTLAGSDGIGSGLASMRFSNASVGNDWSEWEPFASTKAWDLSPGDGLKTVRASLMDAMGNESTATITDTILLSREAGIFRVNAASATPSPDGRSWATAYPTLQAAADAAAALQGGELWVAAGEYTAPSGLWVLTMRDRVSLFGGFAGTETVREQRDWRVNATVIDGQGVRSCVQGANHATLDGCTLRHGGGTTVGGGMYNKSILQVTVTNCVFEHNTASSHGGAMYNETVGNSSVANCVFAQNAAVDGAAMYNLNSDVPVTNCVFVANAAGSYGGGMWVGAGHPATITNCTFSGNTAATGGALSDYGSSVLANCILWGNTAPKSPGIHVGLGTPAVSWSCVQGGYAGTGNIIADPLFVSAPDNLRLQAASPCIDTGTAAGAPATDIAGTMRPRGAGVDMGAYEFTPSVTGGIVLNGGAKSTTSPQVTLFLNWSSISGSPVTRMRFSDDGATWTPWETLSATRAHTLPGADGYHTVRVQFRDAAGNVSDRLNDYILLDTTPPTGTIVINGGASATKDPNVTLSLTWSDATGSGVTRMRFSDNGSTWTAWGPLQATRTHMLPLPPGGHQTVRVQYRDAAGNVSARFSDYIRLDVP